MQRARMRATALYLAATIPFGIAVHLFAEASAVGFAHIHLVFWLRHCYLVGIGLLGTLSFVHLLRSYRISSIFCIHALRHHLPYQGRGLRYFFLSSSYQLGFFGITLATEHDSLGRGDWILGGIVALITAAVGSILLSLLATRIEHVIDAWYLRRELHSPTSNFRQHGFELRRHCFVDTGYGQVIGSRPPPLSAAF